MLKISVIFLTGIWICFCVVEAVPARPGSWKTVPYVAKYRNWEDGPGPGRGYGDHSNFLGHGQFGHGNSYGRRSHHGPSPGYGHGHLNTQHGHGHGHGSGGHISSPYLPIPVPGKTTLLHKLIPIVGFGGSLRSFFNYDDHSSHGSGYSHRSSESPWPWQNARPLWSEGGKPHGW